MAICKDKYKFSTSEASSKAALRTQGVIDEFLNITNLVKFRKLNTLWSNNAKERFGIQERLFAEDNNKAVPNGNAFSIIDKENFKQARIAAWRENKQNTAEAQALINEEITRGEYTEEQRGEFFQLDETKASTASPETIEKVKQAAKKMGIDIQSLTDYAKSTGLDTKSINGVADLVRGVIAVAHGMENITLTEEFVHIATAILEQTNPKLVTELISKIDRFKIYKETLNSYKGNKNYQLSNGKPDIRKIKKEAVDKLIAEVVINNSENITEFPELLQEANRNIIAKWWETIKDYIKGVYRKSNIDIFGQAAQQIISGETGTLEDITSGETFYQLKNDKVDAIYNKIVDIDSRMELNPSSVNDTRHYTFDGKRVAKSVTEKAKENKSLGERTPAQKIVDEQKREWGTEGHKLVENYIVTNLIDKDGYALKTPLNTKIDTTLDDKQHQAITDFAKELIGSYKKGTRFLVERKVVNDKVKGMMASTVDFIAIEPQESGEAKVDILDWKFTDIDKNRTEDIPWFKEKEWKIQMGEYTKILYQYGVKPSQLRKARMIPFIMNYGYAIKGNRASQLVPTSIEIGKIDNLKETTMYLLPVPVNTESTGNPLIDELLKALRTQYEKLYKKPVSPEERASKDLQLNQLRKAIRSLQLQLNFKPLVDIGTTFLNNAAQTFKSFEDIDYSKLTKEEIQVKLGELLEYKKSAEKFISLDEIYLSHVLKDDVSTEDKRVLVGLERIASSTGRMFSRIEDLQKEFVVQLALKEELTTEESKMDVLAAEKTIDSFSKTFLEASKLSAKIIKLATHLIMNAQNLVNRKINNKLNDFQKILLPLEEEAKSKGVKAFSLIGNVTERGLKLIRKIDSEFWKQINENKEKGNKQFFLNNMDVEEYDKLSQAAIDRGIIILNNTQFSSEEEDDIQERNYRIEKLKDSLDIHRETFNGYEGYQFGYLFNKVVKLDGHYSKEYLGMSDNAKSVWEFFTSLNEKARQMGYLDRQGSSFFPLIEATLIEKFANTTNVGSQLKDFLQDFYKTRINEEQQYSKIDEETGQVKRVIPKYFTKLDKDKKVEQLSTDLNRIGALWVKSLYEYENSRELENVLLTLHSVEQSKGSLMLDENKHVILEAGVPKVNKVENKNADILKTIIEDYLYHLTEDVSSLGNIGIERAAEKLTGEEGRAKSVVNVKKAMNNMDTLVRVLGVGLKPLIALANWSGGQFQAFITAGNMYRMREFEKNNLKISSGLGLSTIEKGLLHLIIPLNEDVATEARRKTAKKESLIKWLGTWTFTEVMMSTNAFPERKLQYANAMSFNENSMVINGKIVNIRQYLKEQDRAKYKKDERGNFITSESERRELERTFEDRVAELKAEKSLLQIAKIEDDKVVIPDVSDEEIAKYRLKVIEYNRQLNGQMSNENKAGYRRDTIIRSFMMFKTWIPKLVSARALDIHKNIELDEWQYGRMRVFAKTWIQLCNWNIRKMREIMIGSDEGLRLLDEMLEQKKHDYFMKTGQQLDITEEEFYDLVRKILSEEMRELGLLFGLMGVLIVAKAAQPPEDATDYEKNHYKFLAKAINKISDEVSFYYNPLSFTGMTQGNILPSLSLLVKAEQFVKAIGKETTGYIINDEEMIKKAYPTKYFLNIIPGAAQFNSEVLPYVDPELARSLGIRVTTQSRR